MKRALATLFLATAVSAIAAPAVAQDGYHLPPPPPPMAGYPQVDYAPAPVTAPAEVYYESAAVPYPGGPVPGPAPILHAQHHAQGGYHGGPGLPPLPSVGYTAADRDAWLADCRTTYYGEGKRNGGIIGGLLGAIGGGIVGHEVTNGNRTRRIGGTLIGAGVGGLAGLAIGAAIGAATDRDERIDECEAYLRRWQGGYLPAGAGYGYQQGYGYGYHGYTTVMVPVQVQSGYTYSAPIRRENSYVIKDVIEERVVPATKYVRATKYVKAAPATKYVTGKTVRRTK